MHRCEICEREIFKKNKLGGYVLCLKHMHQLRNNGKFLDNIQRTNNDLNDYRIEGNEAIFNLYNQKNIKIGEFIIDLEDIEKVKYHKWRVSHNHVITGLPAKKTQKDLSWVILSCEDKIKQNYVVDHKDGNPYNNKKNNLRLCEQKENLLNKSFISNNTSGFIGVSYRENCNRYDPEIRKGNTRCHLGYTKSFEEAVYARMLAETIVFKDFANEIEQNKKREFTKNLSQDRKEKVQQRVEEKLKAKNLWL